MSPAPPPPPVPPPGPPPLPPLPAQDLVGLPGAPAPRRVEEQVAPRVLLPPGEEGAKERPGDPHRVVPGEERRIAEHRVEQEPPVGGLAPGPEGTLVGKLELHRLHADRWTRGLRPHLEKDPLLGLDVEDRDVRPPR